MNKIPYIISGALALVVVYLLFWPEDTGPPPPVSTESVTLPSDLSPEEAARRFAQRQPNCAKVLGVERMNEARALFQIECEDQDGSPFTIQYASSSERTADTERQP